MGTNFYRIPTEQEIEERRARLQKNISEMEMTPSNIGYGFKFEKQDSWETETPWDVFVEGTSVHLGKRSMGWKFCWNFHNNKYYSSKQELIDFVLSGRVVDEYGSEIDSQEFLDMAFDWGEPDGLVVDAEYYKNNERSSYFNDPKYYDRIIDGLRVSTSTEFS